MMLYRIGRFLEEHAVAKDHPLFHLYQTMVDDYVGHNTQLSGKNIDTIVTCFKNYWDSIKVTGPHCLSYYETDPIARVFYAFAKLFAFYDGFDQAANKMNIFGEEECTVLGLLIPSLLNYAENINGMFLHVYDFSQLIYAPVEHQGDYVVTVTELTAVILNYNRVVHPYHSNKALDLAVFSVYWKRLNVTDRGLIFLKFSEQLNYCPSRILIENIHAFVKKYLVSAMDQKDLTAINGDMLFQQALLQGVTAFIIKTHTLDAEIVSLKNFPVGSKTFSEVIDLLTRLQVNQITPIECANICWGELISNLDTALQGLLDIQTYFDYCQQHIASNALATQSFMRAVESEHTISLDLDY